MEQMIYQGNDGCLRVLGDSSLVHYNHNHDKLGRFAPRSGSSISYAVSLNRLDNRHVKLRGKEMRASYKADKLRKRNKLSAKNKEKLKKLDKKVSDSRKEQKEIEKFMNKTINEATKKGYSVKSKQRGESSQKGRDFLNAYAGATLAINLGAPGIVGGVAAIVGKNRVQDIKYGDRYNGATPSSIQGNSFRVRKTKNGSKPKVEYTSRYRGGTNRTVGEKVLGTKVRNNSLYGNDALTDREIDKRRYRKKKKGDRK